MNRTKPRSGRPGPLRFLAGYGAGFAYWWAGSHCFQKDPEGSWRLSSGKLGRHLLKVFLWSLELTLLFHLAHWYVLWLMDADNTQKLTAFLTKSVIFLYIKVFWPQVFPEILPGLHVFRCPQCYERRTFRFLPVSPQFGNFVTYLCTYCSCLVDAWGEQIFAPSGFKFGRAGAGLARTLPLVLGASLAGVLLFEWARTNL